MAHIALNFRVRIRGVTYSVINIDRIYVIEFDMAC